MPILRTKLGLLFCVIAVTGIFLAVTGVGGSPALELWNNETRTSLPLWLMIWLGFLALTFLSSVIFAWNHVPARWVLASFVGSHVATIAIENGSARRARLSSARRVLDTRPNRSAIGPV